MSLAQLLNYFVDPSYQRGNLSRISDMHVKTGRPVSFRIDDDLTPIPEGSGVSDEVIRYMLGVLLSEKHLSTALNEDQPEDVDTAFEWKEKGVNFRINVFRDRDGLAFVMRVLASNIPSIQEVGLPSEKIWQDITSLKKRLGFGDGGDRKRKVHHHLRPHQPHQLVPQDPDHNLGGPGGVSLSK